MNDEDELRHRLRELDPVPDEVAMEPPTAASARARLEHIMNMDSADPTEPEAREPRLRSKRTSWLLAAAAAVIVVIGAFAVTIAGDEDDGDVAAVPPLELSLGANDAMASCLPVEAAILADMPIAFAATATAVAADTVTLEVDQWYAGEQAATVELRSGDAHPALIAGFEFDVGSRYLVSAAEGTVNFCGFSGPATPELTALFEDAFGD